MEKKRYLNDLINQGLFRFDRLIITDIDNELVAGLLAPAILREEICLFANAIKSGDDYCDFLSQRLLTALQKRRPLPIVRFADGEYAFYRFTLGCNGLYKQAESIDAIRKVMPLHTAALRYLADHGLFAPLVFPDNSNTNEKRFFSFLRHGKDSSGADFLNFLDSADIKFSHDNYVPFYAVYAYLTSAQFARNMEGKKICILNSEYNENACQEWFARHKSHPRIDYVPIPAEYVATHWDEYKSDILSKIPPDTDLCLAGAGVGALSICADVARDFSIPAIDAGHVLNMMNGRVDKSNGVRLYTLRKTNE
jgi:hypothetical protein